MKKSSGVFVILGSFLFMLLIGIQIAGFQYCIIYICEEYGLSSSQIGLISSVQFIPMFAVPLFLGKTVDRIPRKTIAVISGLCYVAGGLLIFLFHSVIALTIGIFFIATGASISPAILTVLLSEKFPSRSREFANLTEVFFSLGNVVSPLALSVLIAGGMNWRTLYLFVIMISILTVSMLLLSEKENNGFIAEEIESKFRIDIILVVLMFYSMLYNMIDIGFMNYASSYFSTLFQDEFGAGISMSLVGFSMVISKLISAKLRTDKRILIMVSMALSAVTSFLMFLLPGKTLSLVWCVFYGLLTGPSWPTFMSYVLELFPNHKGRASSLVFLGGGIGGIIVGPLMGIMADFLGITYSYLVISTAALLGVGSMLLMGVLTKRQAAQKNH